MRILWMDHIRLDVDLHSSHPLLLINKLSKNGHEVHLVVPSLKGKELFPLYKDTKYLKTLRVPYVGSPSFCFKAFFYLLKIMKKRKPQFIITTRHSSVVTLLALLFPNVHLVLDIRSPPIYTKGIRGFLEKIQYYSAITLGKHFFHGITVTSSAMKEQLSNSFRLDRKKVEVITTGVSIDLFDPKKYYAASKKLRKQFGFSDNFIVMYHGYLTSDRGLQETIEAFSSIALRYLDVIFFILGDGPFKKELKYLIELKSLGKKVYIHEPIKYEEVPKILSMCDIGIIPWPVFSYHWPNSPLKMLEYLGMEKPVIATDVPFNREILEQGECGYLIPSNNYKEIATSILRAYENKRSLRDMGKIGRAIMVQHYSYQRKAKDLEIFLEKIRDKL